MQLEESQDYKNIFIVQAVMAPMQMASFVHPLHREPDRKSRSRLETALELFCFGPTTAIYRTRPG
jgi:hypothetical protein